MRGQERSVWSGKGGGAWRQALHFSSGLRLPPVVAKHVHARVKEIEATMPTAFGKPAGGQLPHFHAALDATAASLANPKPPPSCQLSAAVLPCALWYASVRRTHDLGDGGGEMRANFDQRTTLSQVLAAAPQSSSRRRASRIGKVLMGRDFRRTARHGRRWTR